MLPQSQRLKNHQEWRNTDSFLGFVGFYEEIFQQRGENWQSMSAPFDQMLAVAPMNLWCAAHKVLSAVIRDKSRNRQIRNNCHKCYCFDFCLSDGVLLVVHEFQKAAEFSKI